MSSNHQRGPSSETLRLHAAAGRVSPLEGTRVADAAGRVGTVVAVTSLDFADVQWDGSNNRPELVHVARLHPAGGASAEQ